MADVHVDCSASRNAWVVIIAIMDAYHDATHTMFMQYSPAAV